MNKKGQAISEMIFMLIRVALIGVLILVVVLSVQGVLTSKTDVRMTESLIFGSKVLECIAPDGKFDASLRLEDCFVGEEEYFINVSVRSFDSNFTDEKFFGREAIPVLCKSLKKGVEITNYPNCYDQDYYVLIKKDGELEKGLLRVSLGIAKTRENLE